MDPLVIRDPVFQQLLKKHELAARKLRDAVISLRSFTLADDKAPRDYTSSEMCRAAILQETLVERLEDERVAAEELLRYGFELAPHSSSPEHLAAIEVAKAAHKKRLSQDGWAETTVRPRGFEEQVQVDGGPPVTIVIQPKHYEFTQRAKRARPPQNPE